VDGNSCHATKEGFPSKLERDFQISKKGCQKRGCGHVSQCIYHANKRLCLGYK
jgi:hypothetical protein